MAASCPNHFRFRDICVFWQTPKTSILLSNLLLPVLQHASHLSQVAHRSNKSKGIPPSQTSARETHLYSLLLADVRFGWARMIGSPGLAILRSKSLGLRLGGRVKARERDGRELAGSNKCIDTVRTSMAWAVWKLREDPAHPFSL